MTKFELMTAFMRREQLMLIGIGKVIVNRVEHEDGSTHSFNLSGQVIGTGEPFTTHINTLD